MLSYHHISCHHICFSKFLTSIAVVEWVFPWFPTKNKHVPHEFSHEHCHSPLIFAWVSHDLPMIAIARDQLKPLKRCCSAAHPRTSRSPDVATPPWRSDGKNASTNGSKSMGKDGKSNINHGKTMGNPDSNLACFASSPNGIPTINGHDEKEPIWIGATDSI